MVLGRRYCRSGMRRGEEGQRASEDKSGAKTMPWNDLEDVDIRPLSIRVEQKRVVRLLGEKSSAKLGDRPMPDRARRGKERTSQT